MSMTKYFTLMLVAYISIENDAGQSFGIDYNYYRLDKRSHQLLASKPNSRKPMVWRSKVDLSDDGWKPVAVIQRPIRMDGKQDRENLNVTSTTVSNSKRTSSTLSNGANPNTFFSVKYAIPRLADAPPVRSAGTRLASYENRVRGVYPIDDGIDDDAEEWLQNLTVDTSRRRNPADAGKPSGELNEKRQNDSETMRSFDYADVVNNARVRKLKSRDSVYDVAVSSDKRNLVIQRSISNNESPHRRTGVVRKVSSFDSRSALSPATIDQTQENALEYDDAGGKYADAYRESSNYDNTFEFGSQELDTSADKPHTNSYADDVPDNKNNSIRIRTRYAIDRDNDDTFASTVRNESTSLPIFGRPSNTAHRSNASFWQKENDLKNYSPNDLRAEERSAVDEIKPEVNFTAEYYAQLFDSFGGGNGRHHGIDADSNKKYSQNKNGKLGKHQIEVFLTAPSQPPRTTLLSSSSNTPTHLLLSSLGESNSSVGIASSFLEWQRIQNLNNNRQQNEDEVDLPIQRSTNDELQVFTSFSRMTTFLLKTLIPKTLRANFLFTKKLFVGCWLYGDKENGIASPFSFFDCFKNVTFRILDKAIISDSVNLSDTVSLVKNNEILLHDPNRSFSDGNMDESNWLSSLFEKVRKLFSTHSVKIRLINSKEDDFQVEGRQRRHYRRVFPVIVGAYMIIYSILIPLSFKFLLLLGGKTLFISKGALLLSLIGNLKKAIGHWDSPHIPYYPPATPNVYQNKNSFKRRTNFIANKKAFRAT